MPLHGFRSAPSIGFKWDPIVATGGTTSTYTVGNITYKVHKFTTVGSSTFTVSDPGTTGEVEYVVIGGGGGSGGVGDDVQLGGGGGAGGYRSNVKGERSGGGAAADRNGSDPEARLFLTAGSYSVTVGVGGSAGSGSSRSAGGSGGSSSFDTITSVGGGGGGGGGGAGQSGASGGGGNAGNSFGGARTAGQGNIGGLGGAYGLTGEADVQGGTGAGGGGGSLTPGDSGTSRGEEDKAACSVATTEEISFDPAPSIIDGVSLTDSMRVLVKDQSNQDDNGIYVYVDGPSPLLVRATDLANGAKEEPGIYTSVTSGNVNAGTTWNTIPTRRDTMTVGSDPLIWQTPGDRPPDGGDGGRGVSTSIFTGSPVEYAGGGGGGSGSGTLTSPGGTGYGGGGNGKTSGTGQGTAGTANTGGGAGGSAYYSTTGGTVSGRAGGSGVVAIRYVLSYG